MPVTPPGPIGAWSPSFTAKYLRDWMGRNPLPPQDNLTVKKVVISDKATAPTLPSSDSSTNVATTQFVWGNQSVFNVKNPAYNAKGDGSTDDTVAIQAAITACQNAGGGIVYFPAGTYMLTAYLNVTAGPILFRGEGQATLKLSAAYVNGAQGQGHFFIGSTPDVGFVGLRFDGAKGTISGSTLNNFCIKASAAPRVTVINCYFTNVNGGGSNTNCIIDLIGACDDSKAIGCTFTNSATTAFFTQGARNAVLGNILDNLNDVGIVFNNTTSRFCTAVGNTITTIPAGCAFGVEFGASDFTISGNTITACFGALDLNDAGYSGAQVSGGVFANNEVIDMDKATSGQTISTGVFIRTSHTRNIKIVDNIFSGLTVYGTADAFIYANANTEGLEIRNNTFEGKAQALPACINFQSTTSHTRLVIDGNTFRSTSSTAGQKLLKGVWFGASCAISAAFIRSNIFDNITNYAVHFDTSVTFTGELRNNICLSTNVGALYQASPWGTYGPTLWDHVLHNYRGGRSDISLSAIPATGTWAVGDKVWNTSVAAGAVPGWICVTAGTPGTWKAITAVGGSSTQTPGAVTTVNIAHGLGITPQFFHVQPSDTNARGAPAFSLTATATNIVLTFASALTAATPYTWVWSAG